MLLSSGLGVPELVGGSVAQHGVEDVDAAAGEGEDGLVVGLSFVAFAAIYRLWRTATDVTRIRRLASN